MADPGFRFPAADHDLTDRYLAGEIAGSPIFSPFIHHADVYSAVPDELVSGRKCVRDRDGNDACYIISAVRFAGKNKKSRKLRTIDGDPRKSYWHSEKGKIPLEGTETGGYMQDFVHAIKGAEGRLDRQGWRMKEFGISTAEHGDSHLVLCKVYRTPRNPPTTASASASTTSARTPVQQDVAISSKKRKAADGGGYPSTRPRLTDEHPPMADQIERIKAAMPHAPDPTENLDGFLECYDAEYVKNLAAEAVQANKQAAQPEPEPEWDGGAAPPTSFLQTTMEQEFPFFYPSHSNDDELIKMWHCRPVTDNAGIRAAMPNAPDPKEDLDGYMHCFEEFVKKTVAELAAQQEIDASSRQEQAAQPELEPERGMEQEFPFLYPSHNNDAEEDAPPAAQPEEDVGMIPRCSDDAMMMMPWPSYMHMMMH